MSDDTAVDTQTTDQVVSQEDEDIAVDRTRTKIVADFAEAVWTYNDTVLKLFDAGLESFQTSVLSASAKEATPDIFGTLAATLAEESVKAIIKQLGEAAPGGAVIFAVAKAILKELDRAGKAAVGSSRVDLQACKLEYSIVSPK